MEPLLNRPLSLFIVLLVIFLDWLGIGLVYPMFSSMLFNSDGPFLDSGASAATRSWYLGLLLASMSIAQFFSSPILGALSDQKGRRPLFLSSLLVGIGGYLLCLLGVHLQSVAILVTGRIIEGIAAGNAAVVGATVADLSTDENKGKNFGLYSMACGLGFSLGPYLGGQLSEFGFETPFLFAAVALSLNFALIYFFFKDTHPGKEGTPIRIDKGIRNLIKAFKVRGVRGLLLSFLLFCFGWSIFYEFIPVAWISDYGFEARQIGFAYAYGAAFYALSSGLLIRPFLSWFKEPFLLFTSLLGLGIAIPLLLFNPPQIWVWIYLPLLNFLVALIWPTSTTIVSNCAGKEAQGEMLGIYQSIQAAAFAFSPLVAGLLLGENPHFPMIAAGIAMTLAALIFAYPIRKELFRKIAK
jgi:DHA1 family tetracycline resistance protein-like MFS transporter